MTKRAYLSNVTAIWSLPRQREVLSALPGWPSDYVRFEDTLDARQRRRGNSKVLVQRNEMLRSTTRRGRDEDAFVAALPTFALSIEDMMETLTLAGMRGVTIHFLHEGLTVQPAGGAEVLHAIALGFAQAKRDGKAAGAGRISGDKKLAEAKTAAERIREVYGMPSNVMPWTELLRISGLTRNTIIKHLGARKPHQVTYGANQKRAAARMKRKEAQDNE